MKFDIRLTRRRMSQTLRWLSLSAAAKTRSRVSPPVAERMTPARFEQAVRRSLLRDRS